MGTIFLVEVARIWQALVQDDDVRVPYGKAHENARAIVEEHEGLQKICGQMNSEKVPQDLALLLSCLSSLAVRNEYCQLVSDRGLAQLFDLLLKPDQNTKVLKEVLVVLKALAGNDNVKKDINISQKLPLVVATISTHLVNRFRISRRPVKFSVEIKTKTKTRALIGRSESYAGKQSKQTKLEFFAKQNWFIYF